MASPVLSGDNTTGHVMAATTVGAALSVVLSFGITAISHVAIPSNVEEAMGVLCAVGASLAMQKIAG